MRQFGRLMLLGFFMSPSLHAEGYRYVSIDVPDSTLTVAHGVNARGEIVGYYEDLGGVGHGFLLRNASFKTIDVPGANATRAARGINARGDIVGNYDDSEDVAHGFLLSNGKFHQIDQPGSTFTLLSSINNAGDMVGFGFHEAADRIDTFIRKRNGKFEVVSVPWAELMVRSAQDNGRVLVGSAFTDGWRGFIRTRRGEVELIEYPDLPVPCSIVRYINQRGDMVGNFASVNSLERCDPSTARQRGFLLRDHQFQIIHFPGAADTDPFAINDDGVIVGSYSDKDGNVHGFKAVPGGN